jgi:hypothetical protein
MGVQGGVPAASAALHTLLTTPDSGVSKIGDSLHCLQLLCEGQPQNTAVFIDTDGWGKVKAALVRYPRDVCVMGPALSLTASMYWVTGPTSPEPLLLVSNAVAMAARQGAAVLPTIQSGSAALSSMARVIAARHAALMATAGGSHQQQLAPAVDPAQVHGAVAMLLTKGLPACLDVLALAAKHVSGQTCCVGWLPAHEQHTLFVVVLH